MIRMLLLLGSLAVGLWWFLSQVVAQPGYTSITWGTWEFEMKTATLIIAVLLICAAFYLGLRGLLHLFGLRKRLLSMRQASLSSKASVSLTQGLIQLAEGHWEKAEKLLMRYVDHSETPLLNYLTAARSAHMQQNPERRDELLRKAIASDSKAQVAVGVSQAEMQLSDAQLERAHATLVNLREIAPQNAYVLKLYAKTLFRQQNWDQLLDLLPELLQHNLLDSDSRNMQEVKAATLQGVFTKYAKREQGDKLQGLWKKIPRAIRQQPKTKALYAQALHQAGADEACAAFIISSNNKVWDNTLAGLYGKLQHKDLSAATQQAEKWLIKQADNPVSLLLLARLYQQQSSWQRAKSYYKASLNQSPDTEAYLEFAEMLEVMGERENAEQCYRIGLRYGIRNTGERLVLSNSNRPSLKVAGQQI
ncbi:MAG: heme biosynthesis HemY N-terminal domain-containing protein [Thiolinea sp.]